MESNIRPRVDHFYLCVALSNIGAYEGTPCHNPTLERVDHPLVQVLTLPNRCSRNQPREGRLGYFVFYPGYLEKTFFPPASSLEFVRL